MQRIIQSQTSVAHGWHRRSPLIGTGRTGQLCELGTWQGEATIGTKRRWQEQVPVGLRNHCQHNLEPVVCGLNLVPRTSTLRSLKCIGQSWSKKGTPINTQEVGLPRQDSPDTCLSNALQTISNLTNICYHDSAYIRIVLSWKGIFQKVHRHLWPLLTGY